MEGYLGETEVPIESLIPPAQIKETAALSFISEYGGIDGAHHKQWVLDQVARILLDAPVTAKIALWQGGHEETRLSVGTSQRYQDWVEEQRGEKDENGEYEYDYDEGVAP